MALESTDAQAAAQQQVSTRTHPVRQLLDAVSQGHEPGAEEVTAVIMLADAGPGRDSVRSRLAEVIPQVHGLRDSGCYGEARAIARDAAFELASVTGPYAPPQEDLRQLTPAQLAERISRGMTAIGPAR